jgi:hypothetical protein
MASGVQAKVSSKVPEAADDLLVFGFVLLVFSIAIVWIINTITSSLEGALGAAEAAPGTLATDTLGGAGAGIKSFFTNLF